MNLIWTSELPTKPGYYWTRWRSGRKWMVEIRYLYDQRRYMTHVWRGWQFAGPIPKPKVKK
jgi:hypothetical protein